MADDHTSGNGASYVVALVSCWSGVGRGCLQCKWEKPALLIDSFCTQVDRCCGFDSHPFRCQATSLGVLFTRVPVS